MCELFGMSSSHVTDVNLSLDEFAAHGGRGGLNRDGWGVAFYHEADIALIREATPAAGSDSVAYIKAHQFSGKIVTSHVRMATQGEVVLKNTHPFHRELGGRFHVFVHNGNFVAISSAFSLKGRFLPIGDTDSEYAFCLLMDRLAPLWDRGSQLPDPKDRIAVIDAFAGDMRRLGPANFIYSDGDLLFAHGHQRRHQVDTPYGPPGLHMLERSCAVPSTLETTGLRLASREGPHKVILFASVPLSEEPWVPLEEGRLLVARDGRLLDSEGKPYRECH